MPALSLLFVWGTAGRGWYSDDKLVWYDRNKEYLGCVIDCILYRFLLVLIPSGPSAMLLASLAEIVNVDQGPIAGYLIISVRTSHSLYDCCASNFYGLQYLLSPLIAVVCSLGLEVVNIVGNRVH